jgi:nitroreductase
MDSFAELITKRRSIRQYTEEPLLPQEVEQIMKAALMAPSSKNSRSWQFVLIEDKDMLKQLSICKTSAASFIEHCVLAIVVMTDPLQSEAYMEDGAIAAAYIQLQAEDLSLGTCWCQIKGRRTGNGYDSEQYVKDLLDIPLHLSIGSIITIGHKACIPKPHDESEIQWEKLHIEKYRYDAPGE